MKYSIVYKLLITCLILVNIVPTTVNANTYHVRYKRSPQGFFVLSPIQVNFEILKSELDQTTPTCTSLNPPVKWKLGYMDDISNEVVETEYQTQSGNHEALFYIEPNVIVDEIFYETYDASNTTCKTVQLEENSGNPIFVIIDPNFGFYCNFDNTICEYTETTKNYFNFLEQSKTIQSAVMFFFISFLIILLIFKK